MNQPTSSEKPMPRSLRVPLSIQTDQDLLVLVEWFRHLCMIESLRESFLNGTINLDIRLATNGSINDMSNVPGSATTKDLIAVETLYEVSELVVTEMVLRRHDNNGLGKVAVLRSNAIVTPLARDYAKDNGIRMEYGHP